MSKKKTVYLKIEDWEGFLERYYPSDQKLLKEIVKYHELKDVIEFEAKAEKALPLDHSSKMLELSWLELPQDKFKEDEDLQVFVLKPKKPEVKHEKDKT